MSILVNIVSILTGVILIVYVFKLMADRRMTETQSVLWLLIGGSAIILGFFPKIIMIVAELLGVWYPPAIAFLIAYIGLLFIVLKNTTTISVQTMQINELFIQIALLNLENEKLKEALKVEEKEVDNN